MNISAAINSAADTLDKAGITEHRREAASLLAFVLNREPVFLIAHPEYELNIAESKVFAEAVSRRASREPFQYITGHQEFYGLDFEVGPGVLIPRPETEILVENAISILSDYEDPKFFEIGVGSGCISVSILHNVQKAFADGVDISNIALSVAKRNAATHHVEERLKLREADAFDNLTGKFDLIVSNPPYIPTGDLGSLQSEVGLFEPHSALFAGADGLDIVRRIVAGAPQFLNPKGFLLIEIGFGQSESVKELYDDSIWESINYLADQQNILRVVKARLL